MTSVVPCASDELRVVHVVRSDSFAGVERYITNVAGALARRSCQVTIIGGEPTRMRGSLSDTSVVHRPATTTLQATRQLLRSRPVDLVHAHMSAAELASIVASGLIRSPIVTTRHFAAARGSSLGGRAVAPVIRRAIASEIAISDFVAGSIEVPCMVLRSGVPPRPAGTDRRATVLMAQRLEPEKTVDVGLRAWRASGLQDAGWRLVVAGGGALAGKLGRLARQLGIAGSVDFVGPQSDLQCLLDEVSVFLATAPAEPLGLSVLEAMASSVPVVASASGGHLETVGAYGNQWLFPPGDHVGCADRLRALAEAPELRTAYGQALQHIQRAHFDLDAHAEQLLALYRHTLANARRDAATSYPSVSPNH